MRSVYWRGGVLHPCIENRLLDLPVTSGAIMTYNDLSFISLISRGGLAKNGTSSGSCCADPFASSLGPWSSRFGRGG